MPLYLKVMTPLVQVLEGFPYRATNTLRMLMNSWR